MNKINCFVFLVADISFDSSRSPDSPLAAPLDVTPPRKNTHSPVLNSTPVAKQTHHQLKRSLDFQSVSKITP